MNINTKSINHKELTKNQSKKPHKQVADNQNNNRKVQK